MMKKILASVLLVVGILAGSFTSYAASAEEVNQAEKFEKGETLSFATQEEVKDFLNFYAIDYRLSDYTKYQMAAYSDHVEISLKPEQRYDRESVKAQIVSAFGQLEGTNALEKISDACKKIDNKMGYDVSYQYTSMTEALQNGKGVCWHYAKSASVLLEAAGIETELVYAKYEGITHMLLKCNVDGEWIYADPTFTETDMKYSHITSEEFAAMYVPARMYN